MDSGGLHNYVWVSFLFTDKEVQNMSEVERIEPDQIEVFDNKIAEYLYPR